MEREITVSAVSKSDKRRMKEVLALLEAEGLRLDPALDYLCAAEDQDFNVVGCGGAYKNTLRCFAVRRDMQGLGVMNALLSRLIEDRAEKGFSHLFVYTKCSAAPFFTGCGFTEAVRIEGRLSLLENRRDGLGSWIKETEKSLGGPATSAGPKTFPLSAVVMNADPFTLGHRYLVEKALENSGRALVFVVSEDASPIPFDVRIRMVRESLADLENVLVLPSGPYIISSATFPSYFLRDEDQAAEDHALLDAKIFGRIAEALGIKARFIGEEPLSRTTAVYNRVLKEALPPLGIEVIEIPRFEVPAASCSIIGPAVSACGASEASGSPAASGPISASKARALIAEGRTSEIRSRVPEPVFSFFTGGEAAPVIERIIKAAGAAPGGGLRP